MADDHTAKPLNGGDLDLHADNGTAASLKDTVLTAASEGIKGNASLDTVRQSARDNLSGFGQQAADKARDLAETGKERIGGLLDQLAEMLTDAAGQVDEKLGNQFGGYARNAATSVQGFAQTVRNTDVDDFADEVREYVSKSPAAALGIAAALGFGLARLVHAGIDQRG